MLRSHGSCTALSELLACKSYCVEKCVSSNSVCKLCLLTLTPLHTLCAGVLAVQRVADAGAWMMEGR